MEDLTPELQELSRQIVNLDPADRVRLLTTVFGYALPETPPLPEQNDDDRPRWHGQPVDPDLHKFLKSQTGIFSVEQFGVDADQVADAFEAKESAAQQLRAVQSYFHGFESAWRVQYEMEKVARFLGIECGWGKPKVTAEQVIDRINARLAPLPFATEGS
jgi:hypothetical protein